MDLTTQPNPHQSTIDAISSIAQAKGNDFTVVIKRRRTNSSDLPTSVATLGDARLEHFIVGPRTPELWLPKLAGGSGTTTTGHSYQLTVFHTSDGKTPIGGPLFVGVQGPPRDADPSALEDPEWCGPGICIVPEKAKAKTDDPLHMNAPSGGGQQPPRSTVGVPPDGASPGNGSSNYATALHNAEMSKQWDEVTRAREALSEERRRIEVAAIRRDADAQIAAAKAEAEAARRAAETRQDRIERELAEIRSRPLPTPPTDQGKGIVELLLSMREADRAAQVEMRRMDKEATIELAKIQASAKADADRAHAEMAKANADLQAKLIEVATTKPTGSDMVEKVMISMTGAVSNMVSSQVNMIHTMNELGFGGRDDEPEEKEPAWVKSVERVARLFAPKPAPLAEPQLNEEPPQGEQQQLPAQPAQQQAQQAQPATAVEQIQKAIWSKRNTPTVVANFILAKVSSGDEGLLALFVSEDKISDVLTRMLSKEWLEKPENAAYAKSVASAFMAEGVRTGLFTEEALTDAMENIQTLGK